LLNPLHQRPQTRLLPPRPASWVTTSADRGSSGSFMTLFNYIQGSNAAQERVRTTRLMAP